METGIIWDNQQFFGYFAWPTVARLPGGELVVVASGFRIRHVCPFGKITAFYSQDEGKTWSAPAVLYSSPLDCRDAGIAVSGNKVVVTTFTAGKDTQREYMEKWYRLPELTKENEMIEAYLATIAEQTERKELGAFFIDGDAKRYGKATVTPFNVNAPHGPFVKKDGGFLYVGRSFSFGKNQKEPIYVLSAEDGVRWKKIGEIEYPDIGLEFCECHGVETDDGTILVHMRVCGVSEAGEEVLSIWQCESYDGGKTFSAPHEVISDGAPPHLLRHSSGALICSYANRKIPGGGARARVSYDGGKTWANRIVLKNDANGGDVGYSSSVELKDGSILTVFYHTDRLKQDKTALHYVVWKLEEAIAQDRRN